MQPVQHPFTPLHSLSGHCRDTLPRSICRVLRTPSLEGVMYYVDLNKAYDGDEVTWLFELKCGVSVELNLSSVLFDGLYSC